MHGSGSSCHGPTASLHVKSTAPKIRHGTEGRAHYQAKHRRNNPHPTPCAATGRGDVPLSGGVWDLCMKRSSRVGLAVRGCTLPYELWRGESCSSMSAFSDRANAYSCPLALAVIDIGSARSAAKTGPTSGKGGEVTRLIAREGPLTLTTLTPHLLGPAGIRHQGRRGPH